MSVRTTLLLGTLACLAAGVVQAGEADVEAVKFHRATDGSYRFDVTLRHADTGWDHYADRWEVLTPKGDVIATRTLYHPHVDEQPFTRSLSGVVIPPGLTKVVIRAHDSVHGYGGKEQVVELPGEKK